MKHISTLFLVLLSGLLLSCNNSITPTYFVKSKISSNGETLILTCDTIQKYHYTLDVNNIVVNEGELANEKKVSFLNCLRSKKEQLKDLALIASKNDGSIQIHLNVPNQIDTIFTYKVPREPYVSSKVDFTGPGAQLYNSSSSPINIVELKKWLFQKKEYMTDSLINDLVAYYRTLKKSGYDEYRTKESIPVLHSIEGTLYKVNSDMVADYYALVACSSQEYIDKFVETLVSNNFAGASTSLSQALTCHQKKISSGYKCLVLIGINKDWSYTQQPIGIIAIDNAGPEIDIPFSLDGITPIGDKRYMNSRISNFISHDEDSNQINFKNRQRIFLPPNKPIIFGVADVSVPNWDGNGLVCNVTFRISFSGDVKSITIRRRGDLCYKEYGGGYYLKQEDKIIYAKDHTGSYTFTYKMHFDDGDNIIPIISEDYHGNITKSELRIRARFVSSDAPSIDIDNNIDINNN